MRYSTSLAAMAFCLIAPALPAPAAVRYVPANYPTIQQAVDSAQPGDTIRVSPKPGADPIYHENVHVRVPDVTLQGVSGAILDGAGLVHEWSYAPGSGILVGDNGITLEADGVTVTGFTVRNYEYGTDEPFSQPAAGVAVLERTSSSIHHNALVHNAWGLRVEGLGNDTIPQTHTITHNDLSDNSRAGAMFRWVDGVVTVEYNTANRNGQTGLVFGSANGSKVRYNQASDNGFGLVSSPDYGDLLWVDYLGADAAGISVNTAGGQDIADSRFEANLTNGNAGAGIFLSYCENQRVADNIALGNGTVSPYSDFTYGVGIGVDSSIKITVKNNLVFNTLRDGIAMSSATQCKVRDNLVFGSGENGIGLYNLYGYLDTFDNDLDDNWAYFNGDGVAFFDAFDDSDTIAGTVQNHWGDNHFGTAHPTGLD